MVCRYSGLDGQVLCIISYEGSALDVKINYTVLAANLFIAAIPFFQWHPRQHDDTPSSRARSESRGPGAICSLLFVMFFQISLCLGLGCTGISIVWCAVGGWILMDWKGGGETDIALARQQAAVITIDLLAMTYYLIVADAITSLAHM